MDLGSCDHHPGDGNDNWDWASRWSCPSKAGSKSVCLRVDMSELESAVADAEEIIGRLAQTDVLAIEIGREKEALVPPLDGTVRYQAHVGALGITQRWEARWIQAGRARVKRRGRSSIRQASVRPLGVVLVSEAVEASLLSLHGWRRRWTRRSRLESAMEALVRSVFRWRGRLDVFGPDPQSHPPQTELTEAPEGVGLAEGDAVVGADDTWQPLLAKKSDEHLLRTRYRRTVERRAGEQVAGVQIHHRQRIAVAARSSAQAELAFEVSRPDHIRIKRARSSGVKSGVLGGVTSLLRSNQIGSFQEHADRARRRPVPVRLALNEEIADRLGTVQRVLAPESDDPLRHFRCNPVRMRKPGPRPVREALEAILPEPPEQLVPGLLADTEPVTNRHDGLGTVQAPLDECNSF